MPTELPISFSQDVFENQKRVEKAREVPNANSSSSLNESIPIPENFRSVSSELLECGTNSINNCDYEIIKTGKHRSVFKIKVSSEVTFLKHYKTTNWISSVRNRVLGSQATREYRSIQLAQNIGLEVPTVLSFGTLSRPGKFQESFLLTQQVVNSQSLASLLESDEIQSTQGRQSVIRALSQVVARMIDAKVTHRDFHAGNVLVNLEKPTAPLITLIDLQSFRISQRPSQSSKRLLGTLYHSVALLTSKSDRLRFLKSLAIRIGVDSRAVRSCIKNVSLFVESFRSHLLKKQDRKWKRGNRRLRIQKNDRFEARCVAELEDEFLNKVANNPETLFADENVQRWFKKSKSGRVASLKIPVSEQSPLHAYFKQVQPKQKFYRRLPGFQKSSVQKAWEIGHAFLRRNIPTPKPLFFQTPNSQKTSEYFLCETVPDSVVLSAFYEAYLDEMNSQQSHAWLKRYARLSASVIQNMHDAGYDHRDMKSNNILVSENWDETKMWILDLDSVKQWKQLPAFRRQQNIARFARSSFDNKSVQSTHRLRFLKSYLGENYKKNWKSYWRAIELRVNKKSGNKTSSMMSTLGLLSISFLMLLPGCSMNKNVAVGLPSQHSINSNQLVILSDFKLPKDHKLVQELAQLRKDVSSTLQLDLKEREVVVYLFSDKTKYQKYLDATYPGLPVRRAYFVGTPKELSVYAVWGDRIQEDLRHEYTHGLLHAGLKTVPLWLDEGLAEYFEVAGDAPGGLNASSVKRLTQAYKNGWKPDMNRLELLETVGEMQRMDYQEAWAWIHFMLNENDGTKKVLLSYLQDLNSGRTPTPLSDRLRLVMPDKDSRFVSYLSKLQSEVRTVGFARLRNAFQ